jgi:hypothetical protein
MPWWHWKADLLPQVPGFSGRPHLGWRYTLFVWAQLLIGFIG